MTGADEDTVDAGDADEDDAGRRGAVARLADPHGLNEVLGIDLDEVGTDWVRITVEHNDRFVNPDTEAVMHGGVASTALDGAMSYAVVAAIYDEPKTIGPTLDLNTTFVATADEPLAVTGEVIRVGSCNAIVEGRAEGAETGKLVAKAQGVWRVFRD